MIKGYLGIDIGSVSTKGVIIDSDNKILAKEYLWTKGNPIVAVKELLIKLYNQIKDKNINVIDLKNLVDILNDMSQQIKSVEIYYNPYTTKLANKDMKFAKYFNIITSKEVQ